MSEWHARTLVFLLGFFLGVVFMREGFKWFLKKNGMWHTKEEMAAWYKAHPKFKARK